MILENLFAQAAQGRTFLQMCVCGLLLGAMLHLSRTLRGVRPWLGNLVDAAVAVLLGGSALWVLLGSGEGLRGYALLGLLIGAALYQAGVGRAVSRIWKMLAGPLHFLMQKFQRQAGNDQSSDESL